MEPHKRDSVVLNLKKPWSENHNAVWLASTVKLHRNIEKFKFPNKLESDRKRQIVTLASQELLALEPLKGASFIKAEDLIPLEKEYLVEHFFSSSGFDQDAIGEAYLIDKDGGYMVLFNMSDHLTFLAVDARGELESAWGRLVKMETALGKNVNYSYSQKFGFLTANPAKCGTALSVAIYLQLSGLIHAEKIDACLETYADESVMITGIQGNPTEIVGDILVIQNNFTLGVTEENIISSMRILGTKLMLEENAIRKEISKSNNPNIMDKVSRAFAILFNSYLIEAVEALNAISLLKFGLDVGWVGGVTSDELNLLFFNCRRAHLVGQFNEKINHADIPHKRAEFIHKALKEAKLLI